jgi:hypothetical protein
LTTILKIAKITGSRCGATAPEFARFSVQICAEPMKQVRRKAFPFDGLITPTFLVHFFAIRRNPLKSVAFSHFREKLP